MYNVIFFVIICATSFQMSQRKYLRAAEKSLSLTKEDGVATHYNEEIPSQQSWTNPPCPSSLENGSTISIEETDIDERIFHAFLANDSGNTTNITDDYDESDASDSDAISSDPNTCRKFSLIEELWMFFLIFNLPQRAMTHLLQLFRRLGHDVPSSFAQLKRRHSSTISTVDNLSERLAPNFHYLSVENNLVFALDSGVILPNAKDEIIVNLKINMDGLPLWKSSSIEYWPILAQFDTTLICFADMENLL